MRTSWRTELPQLILLAAMFAAGAVAWPRVPDKLPVHWNTAGEVDRYGGRVEGLFAVPLITLGLYVLMLVVPRLDPRASAYAEFASVFLAIRYVLMGFMMILQTLLLVSAFGWKVPMTAVMMPLMGVLFAVLGWFMPRIRPNWFVGIRTPWTLSSERSWDKTHKLAGWLFPLAGVALAASGFLSSPIAVGCCIAIAAGPILWLVIYSYLVWRDDTQKKSDSDNVSDDSSSGAS
jgi:uncharacterized membrane protein